MLGNGDLENLSKFSSLYRWQLLELRFVCSSSNSKCSGLSTTQLMLVKSDFIAIN